MKSISKYMLPLFSTIKTTLTSKTRPSLHSHVSRLTTQTVISKNDMSWLKLFNEMTSKNNYNNLHQIAGWTDIEDPKLWDKYVADVIQNKIKDGTSIFEVGCGVLAFLTPTKKFFPNIIISGIDGATETIKKVHTQVGITEKDMFLIGYIPNDLDKIPNNSYDCTISNSVFQYLPSLKDAHKTVEHMLRITKPGGNIILSDVCDFTTKKQCEKLMLQHWGDQYGKELRPYLYIKKEWWIKNFEKYCSDIEIRHSGVEEYIRRKFRYIVYLNKK